MTLALREMTIADAKMLVSQAAGDSALRHDLAENPERTASALGVSLSKESAAFLAGLTAAGNENNRQRPHFPFWY